MADTFRMNLGDKEPVTVSCKTVPGQTLTIQGTPTINVTTLDGTTSIISNQTAIATLAGPAQLVTATFFIDTTITGFAADTEYFVQATVETLGSDSITRTYRPMLRLFIRSGLM